MTSSNANFLNYDVLHVPVKNYDKVTLKRREKLKAIKVKESDNFLDLNNGFIPPSKLKSINRQSNAHCDSSAASEPSRRSSKRTSVIRTSSNSSSRVERRATGLYANSDSPPAEKMGEPIRRSTQRTSVIRKAPNSSSRMERRTTGLALNSSPAETSEPSRRSSQRTSVMRTSSNSSSRMERRTTGLNLNNRQLYPNSDSSAAEMSEPSQRSSQRTSVTRTSSNAGSSMERRTSGLSKSLQHHPGHSYIHRTNCNCCPRHEGPLPRQKRLIGIKPPPCDSMADGIFRDGSGVGLCRSHTR